MRSAGGRARACRGAGRRLSCLAIFVALAGGAGHAAEGWAGSASCRECHEAIYERWNARDHGMAMRAPDEFSVRGDFAEARLELARGGEARMTRAGDEWRVSLSEASGESQTHRVDYTFGFEPIQQYLTTLPGGHIQVLPVTYDVAKQEWYELYPGAAPGDWLHWEGRGQRFNLMCIDCHNTDVMKNYDAATGTYATTWREINVGCEACHGPGADHIRAERMKESGPLRREGAEAVVDPFRAQSFSQRQMVDNCGRCHARRSPLAEGFRPGDDFHEFYAPAIFDTEAYYPDGQVREESFEFTSFGISKMYGQGVRCVDCHDPHSLARKFEGNALCLQCHDARLDTWAHTMHEAGTAGSRCEDCHMPQTTYMMRDARRDHSFSIPTPELTRDLNIPNACNRCHTDQTTQWSIEAMNAHYGERARADHPYARTIAAGREGKAEAAEGLARIARDAEAAPAWRASAAALLRGHGEDDAARAALRAAMGDAHPMVAAHAARSLGEQTPGGLPGAVANYLSRVAWAAEFRGGTYATEWDDAARDAVRAQADRLLRWLANKEALDAMAEDPRRHPRLEATAAANRLAFRLNAGESAWIAGVVARIDDLSARGRLDNVLDRERVAALTRPLREAESRAEADAARLERAGPDYVAAMNVQPDDAASQYNLGNYHQDAGNLDEAARHYRRAAGLEMEDPALKFNLAMTLNARGDEAEAKRLLMEIVEARPESADAHYALGLLYGARDETLGLAITHLGRAAELLPEDGRARYNLGLAYDRVGRVVEATRALRQAEALEDARHDAAYAAATIYLREGQRERALEAARRALAADPLSAEAAGMVEETRNEER